MEQNHLNRTGAHSARTLRSTLLGSVLLAALGLSQSYGCDPPPPQPLLASFGASATDITEGQVLLVLEAMKMETEITAPHAGTVAAILVGERDSVQGGQALIELA